jgi:four helix bundle protein
MKKSDNDSQDSVNSHSFADRLEDRLIDFAVRIIRLVARLSKTPAGKHVSGQILRSGTSPAPNYGEARGAESRADFIHKMGVVLKNSMRRLSGLRSLREVNFFRAS